MAKALFVQIHQEASKQRRLFRVVHHDPSSLYLYASANKYQESSSWHWFDEAHSRAANRAPKSPRPNTGSSIPAALGVEVAGPDEVLELPEVAEPDLEELLVGLVADDSELVEPLLPLGDPVETVPLVPEVWIPPGAPLAAWLGIVAKVVFNPAGIPLGPVGTKLAGVVTGRLWSVTTVGWVVTGFGCVVTGEGWPVTTPREFVSVK